MTDVSDTARLAVDIGGTFTDVALEAPGQRVTTKVLTTVAAPEEGVLAGIARVIAQAGIAPRGKHTPAIAKGRSVAAPAPIITRMPWRAAFGLAKCGRDLAAVPVGAADLGRLVVPFGARSSRGRKIAFDPRRVLWRAPRRSAQSKWSRSSSA